MTKKGMESEMEDPKDTGRSEHAAIGRDGLALPGWKFVAKPDRTEMSIPGGGRWTLWPGQAGHQGMLYELATALAGQSGDARDAEPVGHLHSNGDFCQDRAVRTAEWPVYLYTLSAQTEPASGGMPLAEAAGQDEKEDSGLPAFYEGPLPLKPIGYMRLQDGLQYAPCWMVYEHPPAPENGYKPAALFSEDQVRYIVSAVSARDDDLQYPKGDIHPAQSPSRGDRTELQAANARAAALAEALRWYADEAEALARNMAGGAHTQGVLASVTVLSLDAGRRAHAALSTRTTSGAGQT